MAPEGPWRVADYLTELAFGHALIHGRDSIDDSDLAIVEHVAISSVPGHIRPLVRKLAESGAVTTTDATGLCGVSHPTARNYLKELFLLGIGGLEKGRPDTNQPDCIALSDQYQWLLGTLKPIKLASSVRGRE
jgi:hypothetical protein